MTRSLLRTLPVVVVVVVAGVTVSTHIARGAGATRPLPARTPAPASSTASSAREPPPERPAAADVPAPTSGPYAVTTEELVLVDPSRPAPERAGSSGWRRLRTLVLRPEGAPGPVPLIVFAHGYDTEPETYLPLLDEWVAAGYEVAAPELPGSAADLPGTPQRDIADQARDLSFVARAVAEHDADTIDTTREIAAGHSDGGSAVALVAFNSAYSDDQFADYLILSGAIPDQVADGTWGTGTPGRRALITVGDADEYDNLRAAETLYTSTTLPGALVIVPGGDHQRMYLDDSPTAAAVRDLTVHFLDLASSDAATTDGWQTLTSDGDFIVQTRGPRPLVVPFVRER